MIMVEGVALRVEGLKFRVEGLALRDAAPVEMQNFASASPTHQ